MWQANRFWIISFWKIMFQKGIFINLSTEMWKDGSEFWIQRYIYELDSCFCKDNSFRISNVYSIVPLLSCPFQGRLPQDFIPVKQQQNYQRIHDRKLHRPYLSSNSLQWHVQLYLQITIVIPQPIRKRKKKPDRCILFRHIQTNIR